MSVADRLMSVPPVEPVYQHPYETSEQRGWKGMETCQSWINNHIHINPRDVIIHP